MPELSMLLGHWVGGEPVLGTVKLIGAAEAAELVRGGRSGCSFKMTCYTDRMSWLLELSHGLARESQLFYWLSSAWLGSVNPNPWLSSAQKKTWPAQVAWLPAWPGYMSFHNTI